MLPGYFLLTSVGGLAILIGALVCEDFLIKFELLNHALDFLSADRVADDQPKIRIF